jgi:hypothetical protein
MRTQVHEKEEEKKKRKIPVVRVVCGVLPGRATMVVAACVRTLVRVRVTPGARHGARTTP